MVTRLTLDQDTLGSSPSPAVNLFSEMGSETVKFQNPFLLSLLLLKVM
jgi:hypothetical protein